MRKLVISIIFFASFANVSAQLKANSSGEITNTNAPITFKVDNFFAGLTGSSSNSNVSFGFKALHKNTGTQNTAYGNNALYSNTTGIQNTAHGYYALYLNTGSYNTATGYQALNNNSSGYNNTAIGYNALTYNTSGNNNTAIGCWANVGVGGGGNLSNSIAIGYNATATASNSVVIGNYTVNSINGVVTWTTVSDGRTKKNIQTKVPGLDFMH